MKEWTEIRITNLLKGIGRFNHWTVKAVFNSWRATFWRTSAFSFVQKQIKLSSVLFKSNVIEYYFRKYQNRPLENIVKLGVLKKINLDSAALEIGKINCSMRRISYNSFQTSSIVRPANFVLFTFKNESLNVQKVWRCFRDLRTTLN